MELFKIESGTLGLFLFNMKHFFVETIYFLFLRPELILRNRTNYMYLQNFFLLRWNQTYICGIENYYICGEKYFLDGTINL
jgi:hypothetical protein